MYSCYYNYNPNYWNQSYNSLNSNTWSQTLPYPYYFSNNYNYDSQDSFNDSSFGNCSKSPKINNYSTPLLNRNNYQNSFDYTTSSYSLNQSYQWKFNDASSSSSSSCSVINSIDNSFEISVESNSIKNSYSTENSLNTLKRNKRRLEVDNQSEDFDSKKYRTNDYMQCSICYKDFESKASLIMHNHIYHNKGDSKQCPLCLKKLHSYSSTMFHLKIHTKEKDYNCDYCRASFTDATALKRHIRTHTGERPYKCSLCHKAFSQSGNLKRHMKIHIQENISNTNHTDSNQLNKDTLSFNDELYQFLSNL